MKGPADPTTVDLTGFDLADKIDITCDAFEQSWRAGTEPAIASFLTGFEGPARDALVAELVLLDCELRAKRGDSVSRDIYLTRYPEFATIIEQVDFTIVAGSAPVSRVAPADTCGARFAQFELLERVGEGASGTVWKARDTSLRRLIALKLPRLQDMTDAERARFRREGRACAQLHHPNIVSVHQVGDEQGRCYIASEYIDGWNLREWLNQHGRIGHVEAVTLTAQLAEALQHAHQQGVIHRDLKPANVIIDRAGHPHLTDFGLARWAEQSVALTMEGHVVGTPAYMSPEQARGDTVAIDRRADIYGLGAMFYEMLTGKPPFEGELTSVIHRVVNDEPPAPAKVDGKVPRDLETICQKAMQKSPSDRYPSMQVLADDLRRYLRGEPILARRAGPITRAVRYVKRRKAFTGMVAACLLAVAAFAAAYIQAEKNYVLRGYRTVTLSTDPPGARVAFIPLSTETGEPELYRKVLAPGFSPVEVDLLPGDYFVVAVMEDGRFHEVYRHVPNRTDVAAGGGERHRMFSQVANGSIGLQPIAIPFDVDLTEMTLVEGNTQYLFRVGTSDSRPTNVFVVRDLFIDNHEYTVAEDKGRTLADESGRTAISRSFHSAVARAERIGKRLPMEMEFEFVATNAGTTRYPWGDNWPETAEVGGDDLGDGRFGPVGTPAFDRAVGYPTIIGLCSNKAEWMMPILPPSKFDPSPRTSVSLDTARVYRGGSSATVNGDPRPTSEGSDPRVRSQAMERSEYPGLGFRCVRSVEPLVSYEEFD